MCVIRARSEVYDAAGTAAWDVTCAWDEVRLRSDGMKEQGGWTDESACSLRNTYTLDPALDRLVPFLSEKDAHAIEQSVAPVGKRG